MFFQKLFYRLRSFFLFCCFFAQFSTIIVHADEHIVATPRLYELLEDMRLYKLDAQGDQYLHAGDLYEHSIWTYNGMLELLESDMPYVQNLSITPRQKEIVALAALLHDIGKAGRKELFEGTHPKLRYDIIKHHNNPVSSITYYQDHQEHPRICFDYAAAPLKKQFSDQDTRTYYLINIQDASLIPFDMAALYKELGITFEEQKIIALLLGIHYEFGNFKHGKITAEQFLNFLEKLAQEVDYNNGQLDTQIVQLAILIQAADVKGLVPVSPQESYLFPSGIACTPTHEPTKFTNPFEALDYERKSACCCSSDTPVRGVEAMEELITYFNTMYQNRFNSLHETMLAY